MLGLWSNNCAARRKQPLSRTAGEGAERNEAGEGVSNQTLTRPRAEARGHPLPRCGRGALNYTASSIASALETPYSPGFSTWSFFTTPLSTSIA
jgi:hypothetical protein